MAIKSLFYRSWYFIFLIFISGCGVATMAAYHLQDEGQIIPSEQIEIYKNMPEDSPALIILRKQAAKDPEGMLAATLKCAGRLSSEMDTETIESGNGDALKKINTTGKEECYWKSNSSLFGTSNPFTAQQESMTTSLRGALVNLGKSQIIMAKALGLDEQVILAKTNAKNLEGGDLGITIEIEKALELSEKVQEAIDKETSKKQILDAESKKVFITSIPFYIKGVIGSVQTGVEAASISNSLLSLNPAALLQVGSLYSIVTNLPSLVSQLSGSTGQMMDFMTANDIDNSEMKDKLGGIF